MGVKYPPHSKKTQDVFMPYTIGGSTYGTVTVGVFAWDENAIYTEDKYKTEIWRYGIKCDIRDQTVGQLCK